MQYNIEPIRITGANIYGRTSAEVMGKRLKDVQKDDLEEIFHSISSLVSSLDSVHLTAILPIPLKASVLRNLKPGQEIVRLSSGGKHVDLRRDVAGDPGDIGVSCDPDGDKVSVWSLNIDFRNDNDVFTDRGLVWVSPGNPASMSFVIKAQALKTPGLATEIVKAAEEAVKTKVLAHF